jgi:hypothetical protein
MWVIESLNDGNEWERIQTLISECLYVGESILEVDETRISWQADTLQCHASLNETVPLRQLKIEVEVFSSFEDNEDGWRLANSLNQSVSGGAYVYDPKRRSLCFAAYCAIASWRDLALLIFAARSAIGQCEVLSRREDVVRFAKCRSAACQRETRNAAADSGRIVSQRLWDMTQPDYITGLWLSEREREELFEQIAVQCPWAEIRTLSNEATSTRRRVIESMDFEYQASAWDEHGAVFGDNSSLTRVSFNLWTNFGRSMVITTALPVFTLPGVFDDGASHLEAVLLANLLNIASSSLCWQMLGLGSWFAKGSQICFATRIPHANLKPVIMGTDGVAVAELFFHLVDPDMTQRVVRIVARDLHTMGVVSRREPSAMDSMNSLVDRVSRPNLDRVDNETVVTGDEAALTWTWASHPLLAFGIFDHRSPAIGSIELVATLHQTLVVLRLRQPAGPSSETLAVIDPETNRLELITDAIAGLSTRIPLPDFLDIPVDISEDLRDAVWDGLYQMAEGFGKAGVDLIQRGLAIRNQPDPWSRDLEGNDVVFAVSQERASRSPSEIYLSSAMQLSIVDINIGLFQAWWEGALAMIHDPGDPGDPDAAARKFVDFAAHTRTRLTGKTD